MSRLGSAAMARQIADHDKPIPEGWTKVGEGSYREAFLAPDGVCYKRNRSGRPRWQTNAGEWKKYRQHRKTKLPGNLRLPRMRYFPSCGVLATEHINGLSGEALRSDRAAHDAYMEASRVAQRHLHVWDTHDKNFVVVGPTVYLVDLGDSDS